MHQQAQRVIGFSAGNLDPIPDNSRLCAGLMRLGRESRDAEVAAMRGQRDKLLDAAKHALMVLLRPDTFDAQDAIDGLSLAILDSDAKALDRLERDVFAAPEDIDTAGDELATTERPERFDPQ